MTLSYCKKCKAIIGMGLKEVIKRVEKNKYVDYFGNRLIKQENKFICKCGCSKFRKNDDENFITCILCLKVYKMKGAKK